MIASINGPVIDKDDDGLVIEVGGLGLHVAVPATLRNETTLNTKIQLFTHLIVRETELTLYGFKTREERQFFHLLLGVNGVGPRLALTTLSTLNPGAIRRAIFNEQAEVLNQVPGIGKKTAQKIVLHLQDKMGGTENFEPLDIADDTNTQVIEALTSMGFSIVEAQSAIQNIPKDTPEDVEERLRIALGYFNSP